MPNPRNWPVSPRGTLSRRRILQLGAPMIGLGVADVLRLRAIAGISPRGTRRRSLIVFWTHGGMSQQDTYDLKPDAPAPYRGRVSPDRNRSARRFDYRAFPPAGAGDGPAFHCPLGPSR